MARIMIPAGYPDPNSLEGVIPFSLNSHAFRQWSLITLAQMLAALTMGNKLSAFFDTVTLTRGNMSCIFL